MKSASGSQRSALMVVVVASFLTPFMGSAVNIALPNVGADLSLDAVQLSWVATAYLLSAAVFLVPFGRIADIRGRKLVFLWGIVIYTFSSLLLAMAYSAATVIGGRVLQGMGSAMMFGTGMAILVSVFPPGKRGRVLGFTVAAVYAGLSLGPFLGGILTQHLGWRSVFLINVPLGTLILVITLWKLKDEWVDAAGESFDISGAVLYGLSLVLIIYGLSRIPEGAGFSLLAAGIILLVMFVRWQNRRPFPLLDISLFHHNKVFTFSNLAALIHYSSTFAVIFLLSLFLQHNAGFSPQAAGSILLCQPVVMALFSPLAGRMSDHWQPRYLASSGMALTAMGLGVLTGIQNSSSLVAILTGLILIGLGFALFSSPNTNAIMNSVSRKQYGVASGTVSTMRLCGQMLSMGISTVMINLFLGPVQLAPEHYPGFISSIKMTLVIFIMLSTLGIFASMIRGNASPNLEGGQHENSQPIDS